MEVISLLVRFSVVVTSAASGRPPSVVLHVPRQESDDQFCNEAELLGSCTIMGPLVLKEPDFFDWVLGLSSIRFSFSTQPGIADASKLQLWQAARVALTELAEHLPAVEAAEAIERTMRDFTTQTLTGMSLPMRVVGVGCAR